MPPIFGPSPPPSRPQPDRRRINQAHILEATAAAVLAAAVLGTASGMGWLVIALPSRLEAMQQQITQLLRNQEAFSGRFKQLEDQVNDHDRRIIKLEVKQ